MLLIFLRTEKEWNRFFSLAKYNARFVPLLRDCPRSNDLVVRASKCAVILASYTCKRSGQASNGRVRACIARLPLHSQQKTGFCRSTVSWHCSHVVWYDLCVYINITQASPFYILMYRIQNRTCTQTVLIYNMKVAKVVPFSYLPFITCRSAHQQYGEHILSCCLSGGIFADSSIMNCCRGAKRLTRISTVFNPCPTRPSLDIRSLQTAELPHWKTVRRSRGCKSAPRP